MMSFPAKCRSSVLSNEYKLLAEVQTSDQNAVGLAVIAGQVVAISLHCKTKQTSSNASTTSTDSSGCEDGPLNNSMTMLAPMTTGNFIFKLFLSVVLERSLAFDRTDSVTPENT